MAAARRFASTTTVPVEKSKMEIEQTLARYGADGFMAGWDAQTSMAMLQFRVRGRFVRMSLALPSAKDYKNVNVRSMDAHVAQETRQRWRALLLVVKAKLEAVESKVATFEQEFLPYIVMPGGQTVGEEVLPQIAEAYKTGGGTIRLLTSGGTS